MSRMLHLATAVLALLAWAALASATTDSPEQVASPVGAAFERYKDCAVRDAGKETTELVSRGSITHYGVLIRAARAKAPIFAEASLRQVDRMQIQMFRKLLSAEELTGMSPEAAVAYAFESRMMGEEFEDSSTIDRVKIEGDEATARHMARGRPVGAPYRETTFRFVNEGGQWRVDLLHTLDVMEAQLEDLASSGERSKEELAETIVAMFVGEAYAERLEQLRQEGKALGDERASEEAKEGMPSGKAVETAP